MAEKIFSYGAFIRQVLSVGRISFSIEEVMQQSGSGRKIAQVSLSRLASNGEIVLVRRGFYVIITPEFSLQKNVPPLMYVDDLMKYIGRDYYISLLSAAALHGAAHQQPMRFFVTTGMPPVRNIENDRLHIAFNIKKEWNNSCITQMKTRTGYVNVSTPEATMLDLVENQRTFGLARIVGIVDELSECINKSSLRNTATYYPTAIIQRLGYIFESLLEKAYLTKSLSSVLAKRTVYPQYLSLSAEKRGTLDEKWKVIVNDEIETDVL